MNVFDLAAKITLDSSEYESGLQKIGGMLGTATKVVGAAVTAASTAVVAFGKSSVDAGAQFDSSMSQVAATMGFTMEELNDASSEASQTIATLGAFAQEMGSKTAFSASEAADALNYMALAGYDADTSMKMLPQVLDLAAAGGIDLAAASDMVTDAQSALGLKLEETEIMVNEMARASSKTNTSVSQLGDAILTVGGTAKNLRGGTNELTTVLGVLADNGIKASEAGTHLRNIMLAMTPTSEAAAAAWEELGVEAYDDAGNMRLLSDVFDDLSDAMDGMSDEERLNTLSAMFNKTDLSAVVALLDTETERWDELERAMEDTEGAASAMAEVQLDNLNGDITLFKSALEGAQIAVSEGLTPDIRQFVQFGTQGLSRLTEAFKTDGISGAMAEMGDLLSEGLTMIIDNLPEWIEAGMELLSAVGKGIMDNLPVIMDAALEVISMFVEFLIENTPAIFDAAFQIVTMLGTYLVENLEYLADAALNFILMLATFLVENLPSMIPYIVNVITQIVFYLIENVDLLVEAALQIMIALAEGLIKALPTLIEKAPAIIFRLVAALLEMVPEVIGAGVQLIVELAGGIVSAFPSLLTALMECVVEIPALIAEVTSAMIDAGKNLVSGLWEGIKNSWANLKQNVKDLGSNLVDGVKDVFGIHSPSKVFAQIGEYCVEGFGEGFEELADGSMIEDALNNASGTFKADVSGAAAGGNVTVVLEGELENLFRAIVKENNIYKDANGVSALA